MTEYTKIYGVWADRERAEQVAGDLGSGSRIEQIETEAGRFWQVLIPDPDDEIKLAQDAVNEVMEWIEETRRLNQCRELAAVAEILVKRATRLAELLESRHYESDLERRVAHNRAQMAN